MWVQVPPLAHKQITVVVENLPGRVAATVLEGGIPERSKGSDCKSDGYAFTGSNPVPPIWLQFGTVRNVDCVLAIQKLLAIQKTDFEDRVLKTVLRA